MRGIRDALCAQTLSEIMKHPLHGPLIGVGACAAGVSSWGSSTMDRSTKRPQRPPSRGKSDSRHDGSKGTRMLFADPAACSRSSMLHVQVSRCDTSRKTCCVERQICESFGVQRTKIQKVFSPGASRLFVLGAVVFPSEGHMSNSVERTKILHSNLGVAVGVGARWFRFAPGPTVFR